MSCKVLNFTPFSHPTQGESFILCSWLSYHLWEDGRSNYAWDLAALGADDFFTYEAGPGYELEDYRVFGKEILPLMLFVCVCVCVDMSCKRLALFRQFPR